MFFLPFLAGAAVIGAGAYCISKIIQSNKPITITLLKEILFQEFSSSLRSALKKSKCTNLGIFNRAEPKTIFNETDETLEIFNGAGPKIVFNKTDKTNRQRSEIGSAILARKDKALNKGIIVARKDKALDKGITKSYVDVEYNDKVYRIVGPSISPELKPGITC